MRKIFLNLFVVAIFFNCANAMGSSNVSNVKLELSALGFDEKSTSKFLEDFKFRLQKKDYSSDMFGTGWDEALQVKKYTLDGKEKKPEIEVLRLSFPGTWDYFFVFFSRGVSGKWKSIGFVDSSSKYEEAVLGSVNCKKHNLISLSQCDGGTGVFNSYRDIYLIDDKGLKKLFSYPAKGYRNTWGLMYDETYSSKPLQCETDANGEFLELLVSVDYSCGNCGDDDFESKNLKLFNKSYRFVYAWDGKSERFNLDNGRSSQDKKPSEVIDSMKSDEEFLTRSIDNLKQIVTGQKKKQKQWLKCFLENCKPETKEQTKAKEQLLGLLK